MAPRIVASLRIHLCEVERGVCVSRFGPYNLVYVLEDGFEVGDSCTWVAGHEVAGGGDRSVG